MILYIQPHLYTGRIYNALTQNQYPRIPTRIFGIDTLLKSLEVKVFGLQAFGNAATIDPNHLAQLISHRKDQAVFELQQAQLLRLFS